MEDKFCLRLTEEEAVKYLQGLIDLSIKAIFPELMERIHKIAQVWIVVPVVPSTSSYLYMCVCIYCRTSESDHCLLDEYTDSSLYFSFIIFLCKL